MKHSFIKFLKEWRLGTDRVDLELGREIQKRKDDAAADAKPRDDFNRTMSMSAAPRKGDRVYNPKNQKFYAIRKITDAGVFLIGVEKPILNPLVNTGKKTELGHRVFALGKRPVK